MESSETENARTSIESIGNLCLSNQTIVTKRKTIKIKKRPDNGETAERKVKFDADETRKRPVDDGTDNQNPDYQSGVRVITKDDIKALTSEDDAGDSIRHCYLLANYDPSQKINTHIGSSRDPFEKRDWYNKIAAASKRTSRKPKPFWKLLLIIGPFHDKEKAKNFKKLWKKMSRGIEPRRERGIELAKWYNQETKNNPALQGVPLQCWDVALSKNNTEDQDTEKDPSE